MKAMIFAAGLGTRLKPFTLSHPKALVPVAGVPMLQRVIMKLKHAGIDEMVVNVHHFAGQIIDFLDKNYNFGVNIHISDESDLLLDTGGGILKARRWLDDSDFVVHNADILTDFDISGMIGSHNASHANVTLLADSRVTSRYLLFDNGNRMSGWQNTKTGELKPAGLDISGLTPKAFGGVHLLSPRIFDTLQDFAPANVPFSIIDYYIVRCNNLDIRAYTPAHEYKWHDVGKPESLAQAEASMLNSQESKN